MTVGGLWAGRTRYHTGDEITRNHAACKSCDQFVDACVHSSHQADRQLLPAARRHEPPSSTGDRSALSSWARSRPTIDGRRRPKITRLKRCARWDLISESKNTLCWRNLFASTGLPDQRER